MISCLRELLGEEKCNIRELDNRIMLSNDENNIYAEDYVEIERLVAGEKYKIYEVHRDVKCFKIAAKKMEAAIYATVVYKKIFDNTTEQSRVRKIRNYVNMCEEENALECIKKWFDDSIYSIGKEDKHRISFMQSGNYVDVKFGGIDIVMNASIERGYVVLYNYCEKLQNINRFYDKLLKKIDCNLEKEKIIKMYIL